MEIAPVHPPVATPPACTHCGLPLPTLPAETGPHFCCAGCEVVYETLHASGYADTFYRLRAMTPTPALPAPSPVDGLSRSILDDARFVAQHTTADADGTRRTVLYLEGVHCAACVWLVERLPFECEGVLEARLDLPRARLALHWDPDRITLSGVAAWLSRVGYSAHPLTVAAGRTAAERRLLIKLGVCWAIAGNVMLLAFAFYAGLDFTRDAALTSAARWLSLGLSIPAVCYGGSAFFRRAFESLRHALRTRSARHLHMDTPIALGLLVGFSHSAWATIQGRGEVWFDSITILIAALLTARWLQLRSRRLAGDATERLLSLIPPMARRKKPTGTVETVRSDTLNPGDTIHVSSGEVIPADGRVCSGRSSVNNAVLTGESRPEPVEPGSRVAAGATNLTAPLTVRVEAVGDATQVGRLLSWVRDAAVGRAPVVMLADRLAGYFVAGVLTLGVVTLGLWLNRAPGQAAQHVVALLVITCPCALGMATPLSMAMATGRAAHAGTFVKTGAALELLSRVDTVVLDKTGTVTKGALRLLEHTGDPDALRMAAALETQSNHPLAAAFLQSFPATDAASPGAFASIPGKGLRGRVAGHRVVVGSPAWVRGQATVVPSECAEAVDRALRLGHTPVAVAVDGCFRAVAAFGDEIREDAFESLRALHASGKTIYLLSGDHPDIVRAVARRLGIRADRAMGGATPEEKLAFIEAQQAAGHTVAMVGDGVNDAAALQAASVGIAVEGGSTASRVTADVFLTRHGLAPVLELFAGADRVMQVIRGMLAFSLLYNVAGAAAAMAGMVSPLVAAVAMPVSSLVVVFLAVTRRSFPFPPARRRLPLSPPSRETPAPFPAPPPQPGIVPL